MLVDTTQEGSSGILADIRRQQAATPWVLIHERGKVVNKAADEYEWASLGLFLD